MNKSHTAFVMSAAMAQMSQLCDFRNAQLRLESLSRKNLQRSA